MGYWRWYADNMWVMVPAQDYIKKFLATFEEYPYQAGASLNAAGINYRTLKAKEVLKKLETLEYPRN